MHPQINTTQQRGEALADVIRSYPEVGTLDEHISYAHALADLGIHVVILPPGQKKPFGDYRTPEQTAGDTAAGRTKKGWYLGTTDKQRLADYITRCLQLTGALPNIGMQLGPSRAVVVDADNDGDAIAFHRLPWEKEWQVPTPCPFTVRSPGQIEGGVWTHRDGVHCYYLLPDGIEPDSVRAIGEAAVTGPITDPDRAGWEVKVGSLGVALPPSVRDEGAYTLIARDIPVAPAWLLDLIAKPEPKPKPALIDLDEDTIEFHESVDDAMNAVPWSQVLEGIALEDGHDGDGCTIYTRPGGSRRSMIAHDGCDAVNGAHCVTVHSDTVMSIYPALQDILDKRGRDGRSFSKWEALAAFQFDGSLNAVAQAYGFSRPAGPPADWSGVFVSNDLPFGVSLSWTPDGDDLCPHGAPHNGCVPCMSARRAAIIDGSA